MVSSGKSLIILIVAAIKNRDPLFADPKRAIIISTRGRIAKELLERAKFIDLRKLKNEISQ